MRTHSYAELSRMVPRSESPILTGRLSSCPKGVAVEERDLQIYFTL